MKLDKGEKVGPNETVNLFSESDQKYYIHRFGCITGMSKIARETTKHAQRVN